MKFFLTGICLSIFQITFAATFTVSTNTYAALNAAIISANVAAGPDIIAFNLPAGSTVINLGGNTLNTINGDLTIDGTTQTGYSLLNPVPMVEITNSGGPMFTVSTTTNGCVFKALSITNSGAMGLNLNAPKNKIIGCYIGVKLDGTTPGPNGAQGINMTAASNNNIIGGPSLAERNIISANKSHGIQMLAGNTANYVIGNYIGTDKTGLVILPNLNSGVNIDKSTNIYIGGSTADSSNIISGNLNIGVLVTNASSGISIKGNIIGLGADGFTEIGNREHGISISQSSNVKIGGNTQGEKNVLSKNGAHGILLLSATNVTVKGNYIGTDKKGLVAKGNTSHGIQLQDAATSITIGGSRYTDGNIISANGAFGINFEGDFIPTTGVIIKGNLIGCDSTTTQNLGNNIAGIALKTNDCIVGGVANDEGNVIAGTKIFCGILLVHGNRNIIKGNFIGVGLDSTTAIPNKTDGINVSVEKIGYTSSNNIIQHNIIAYNTENGINVGAALNSFVSNQEINNNLRFNSIYCNKKLGISLNLTIVADQGNNGKTAPKINNSLSTSSKIVGLANGLPSTDLIDIFEMIDCIDCVYNPQGKIYLATVSPDASGNWSYDHGTPISGTYVTIATDVNGNTSQFSLCYSPCGADASYTVSPSSTNLLLVMNKITTVTATSTSTVSNLNPAPIQLYWNIGSPDTTTRISNASVLPLNFSSSPGVSVYSSGIYQVYLVAKQQGCMDTTSFTISAIFIPNMITPNNDHANDQWSVTSSPNHVDAKIYNKWGDLIYQKESYINEWDASNANDGVYYYQIDDKTSNGTSHKGWLQVIK